MGRALAKMSDDVLLVMVVGTLAVMGIAAWVSVRR